MATANRSADRVRLLAKRSQRGYTTDPAQALRDEPEALSAVEQQALTDGVHRAHDELVRQEWVKASERINAALEHFERFAHPHGLRREVRAITRQLDTIDRRTRRSSAAGSPRT